MCPLCPMALRYHSYMCSLKWHHRNRGDTMTNLHCHVPNLHPMLLSTSFFDWVALSCWRHHEPSNTTFSLWAWTLPHNTDMQKQANIHRPLFTMNMHVEGSRRRFCPFTSSSAVGNFLCWRNSKNWVNSAVSPAPPCFGWPFNCGRFIL